VRHHLWCNQAWLCQQVYCHAFHDTRLGHYCRCQRYHSASTRITCGVTQTGRGTKALIIAWPSWYHRVGLCHLEFRRARFRFTDGMTEPGLQHGVVAKCITKQEAGLGNCC